MITMTNEDIKAYYDGSNITLAELSVMTGKTVKQLKTILLTDHWQRLRADYPAIERAIQ